MQGISRSDKIESRKQLNLYLKYMKKEQPKTETKTISLPINRMSYSGLTQLLRNPLIFKLKYILNVYDGKMSVSGMVGRAGHEALKAYYSPVTHPELYGEVIEDRAERIGQAIDAGLKLIEDFDDSFINYGKTGSREQLLSTYHKAMQFYFAEEPEYNHILFAEEKLEGNIETVDGQKLPIPAVATPDIIDKRKDGGIDIVDTKFVKSFTDYETEDYIKIIQAQFLWHTLKAQTDLVADRMVFREIKTSENTGPNAGKPQIRDYVIPFSHEPYRIIFYNLYRDVVRFLSNPDSIYLPNLSDPFDGEHAGMLYAQGLLSSDMSDVEVMHKVKEVALVSKKFVPSRLDRVENQHLLPEEKIKLRLAEFGIPVEPEETKVGSSVTQYRFKVSAGVRMGVFEKHKADIARAIEAKTEIRILAPIPGTSLVGIEVANDERSAVILNDQHLVPNTLSLPIGADVHGEVVKILLDEAPHLLIAGSTGSGKSVLLHSIITALTKQMAPKDMSLVLIDPKRVELTAFAEAKHLKGGKIIFEYAEALLILKGLADEMERRYKLLAEVKARTIKEYNDPIDHVRQEKMPYIVLVIDEFADLIMQGKSVERRKKMSGSLSYAATKAQVEQTARQMAKLGIPYEPKTEVADEAQPADELIARLAQMARAVGIHLIIATQRPSVDVITGLIKANFPTRIAMTTASATDSKVILGEEGAEKLSGKGDLLLMTPGRPRTRLQGFLTA